MLPLSLSDSWTVTRLFFDLAVLFDFLEDLLPFLGLISTLLGCSSPSDCSDDEKRPLAEIFFLLMGFLVFLLSLALVMSLSSPSSSGKRELRNYLDKTATQKICSCEFTSACVKFPCETFRDGDHHGPDFSE